MHRKLVQKSVFVGIAIIIFSAAAFASDFQYQETKDLVGLVQNAAALIQAKGTSAFNDFKSYGTKWYHGETFVFVLDKNGKMLCNPDPSIEGTNVSNLIDVDGRPFIKQIINEALDIRKNNQGFVDYLWPRPGRIFPVWKTDFAMKVSDPYGNRYIVGSGAYEMKPDKAIIEDDVADTVFLIESRGDDALNLLHNKIYNTVFGNLYLFVDDSAGTELINPAFPELQGKSIINLQDNTGKFVVKDYIDLANRNNSGWVEYYWPKPGDSTPSKKSTFVKKANFKDSFLVVGCGLYFDESNATSESIQMTSDQLISLVVSAADLVKQKGEKAFPEFRKQGSPWINGDSYVFVWSLDGKRLVYPPNPALEGIDVTNLLDPRGRNIGQFCFNAVDNPSGEGWAHYEWNKPGAAYTCWKSNYFVKAKAPSGKEYLIGSGIYNMNPDKKIIEDRVNKAAALLQKEGQSAFMKFEDKLGEFVYLDNYVFVDDMTGTELVNPIYPNLEGKNLMDMKDSNGKAMVKVYIDLANKQGAGWVDYMWPRPGTDDPMLKHTYVKKVKVGNNYFVVGSGAFF